MQQVIVQLTSVLMYAFVFPSEVEHFQSQEKYWSNGRFHNSLEAENSVAQIVVLVAPSYVYDADKNPKYDDC